MAMHVLSDPHVGNSGNSWRILLRLCLLSLVLVTELLSLTLSFESPNVSSQAPLWLLVASDAPQFINIALAFLGASLVLMLPRLKSVATQAWLYSAADRRWWPWLVLNSVGFAALYAATAAILGETADEKISSAGLAFCLGMAIATSVFWALAFMPIRFWNYL